MGRISDKPVPVERLSYREIQAELKALGLPAKGTTEVLNKRLTEARAQTSNATTSLTTGDATLTEQQKSVKSPSRSMRSPSRRTRQKKEQDEEEAPEKEEVEQDVVRTESQPGSGRKSRLKALRKSTVADFPQENASVKANEAEDAQIETPLEKVKRVARKSAAELQKSITEFHETQIQRRKLGWIWPTLTALLLALLIGSQWKHSAHWQSHINTQLDGLQRSVSALYEASQIQAVRLGQNLHTGVGYLQDGVVSGLTRASNGAQDLWDTGSEFTSDALGRASHYLPSTKKLRGKLPTFACCAQLNATELDPLLPNEPVWADVRESLHEAWAGLKDDPLKGIGVLLAGSTRAALRTAAVAVEKAVPANCKDCYLHLKGDGKLGQGGADAAGQLQAVLASHLAKCPYAIIHIEAVNSLHINVLPVLLSALSEQGSLTQDGKQVPAHKAIYIGSALVPSELLSQKGEKEFAAAVKKDLVFQLEVTADPTQLIIPEAFRRLALESLLISDSDRVSLGALGDDASLPLMPKILTRPWFESSRYEKYRVLRAGEERAHTSLCHWSYEFERSKTSIARQL